MQNRAQLLAGLRTGGPRASSPSIEVHAGTELSPNGAQLKASAAPFTPSTRASVNALSELDAHLAAMRLQHAISASGEGHDFAAQYGALHGQPSRDYPDETNKQYQFNHAEQMALLERAATLQHQQNQLEQLEQYRLQASILKQQQQQQQQQQLAAQQYMMMAHLQAESTMHQAQSGQSFFSMQEQRQAARANFETSLRQRQVQQAYQQNEAELRQQQHALMQQLQYLRQSQTTSSGRVSPATENSTSWRSNSTSVLKSRTSGLGDQVTSWRSSSNSIAKDQPSSPPSIVVDDSASEPSECGTAHSRSDSNETPETSAEDVGHSIRNGKAKFDQNSLGVTAIRPVQFSAPRSRVLSVELKPAGSRQPRGPPTEFAAVNFASRMAARTRREAMSKLCASPRAATFSAPVSVA